MRTRHASSLVHAAPQHNTTRHLRSTTAHHYTRRLPCTRPGTTCTKLRLSSFSPPYFTLCRRGENSFDAFLWWAVFALCLTCVASKTVASKACLPSVASKPCLLAKARLASVHFLLLPLKLLLVAARARFFSLIPPALPSHPCALSPHTHTPVAAVASWPDSKTTCGASALCSFMHPAIVCVGGAPVGGRGDVNGNGRGDVNGDQDGDVNGDQDRCERKGCVGRREQLTQDVAMRDQATQHPSPYQICRVQVWCRATHIRACDIRACGIGLHRHGRVQQSMPEGSERQWTHEELGVACALCQQWAQSDSSYPDRAPGPTGEILRPAITETSCLVSSHLMLLRLAFSAQSAVTNCA